MKSALFQNQSNAKEHLIRWKVGALFMEAGTGKTRVAYELVKNSSCDGLLWLGPLRTLTTAQEELNKWGGFSIPTLFLGVESIQQSDRIFLNSLDFLATLKTPFVVVDESLKIKNAEAKRTKRILEIGKRVEYKLILNGTPLSRNLLDLWSQMEFLSPKILNMTLSQFKNTFCNYTVMTKRIANRVYSREWITGYENVDYLYSLIRHYVYKCDLTLNITQNYHTIKYCLDDMSYEEYQTLKSYYLRDEVLEWKNNNIFIEMTQKMQHAYCCSATKFAALDKLFESVDESNTLIFCKYVSSCEACRERYPKARVLSYQKESFGLNLQSYHNTVFFDKIWDYALKMQSSHRTFRTGQEYDCEYWELTGNVGLEHLIDKNIDKKISLTEYFKSKTREDLEKEL